ncbi:type II toxin-antitoxin system RelE/ParE family toxin [Citrobacter freundii]|jgi:putative addiction module killer protein|uniref:Type II toxin-antitoxin system RelE/ParE family toxin n=2 Tax=Citrobacter freundii complex TaxID=1344959 RepID=A0A7D6VAV3_CITFR|nr:MULTISPECIES: type II toxin-antitoxin system RelE/ParE family toxin [Citrobacter]MBA8061643.1 type II toxin-antitoxin system RelE/ParE family toxin [Citrobacter freundii]MBA8199741.1 type II toxin-antitoxin system RelE/ParE family toxin [Citrobacter freundii]MCS3465858.1 putative addiction module killer protein [Citrobacter sp. JUb117]NTZ52640.1 type II toxin-antitoxin system RelE/ParE family toxin [Citrobacter gillenii]QCA20319.1 type II toxin-antitoxin system RelE/ParE family toxin [Citro
MEILQTMVFQRWEQNLRDRRAKTLIATRLFRLANGLAGDVKPVGEGISEMRISYGPGYRIYFKQQGCHIIILLCGGDKSSQANDITMAKMLARSLDYQEIRHHE